jgi:hypothetical protein
MYIYNLIEGLKARLKKNSDKEEGYKTKYKVEKLKRGVRCLTRCNWNDCMVGSMSCIGCENLIKNDRIKKIVYCKLSKDDKQQNGFSKIF